MNSDKNNYDPYQNNFNQNHLNPNQNNFNQGPGNYNQGPGNYNQGPGNYNQGPNDFGQGFQFNPHSQENIKYHDINETYSEVNVGDDEYQAFDLKGIFNNYLI